FKKLDASFIGAPQRGKRPMRGQQRYQMAFHQLQYSSTSLSSNSLILFAMTITGEEMNGDGVLGFKLPRCFSLVEPGP
ncbi:hypothetical protein OAG73_01945, partial [bacterium]|nr:hypothetical protein [bacterium]